LYTDSLDGGRFYQTKLHLNTKMDNKRIFGEDMEQIKEAKGRCLCGNVTITVKDVENKFGACHCDMCQVWTGGPQFGIGCGTNVEIEGKEYVTTFNSSPWAERAFCKECGTHLYYRVKQSGDYRVLAGFLKDISPKFDIQFFIDKKPEYYTFADQTNVMTEKQIMEYFASKM
jgi:hypothetical protein